MLGDPDQRKFDHFQDGKESNDDLPLVGISGKKFIKRKRLLLFKYIDKLRNPVLDRELVGG